MNPLDPLELSSFNERLLKIIPLQNDTSFSTPFNYGHLPKDIKKHMNKQFEKTLDKYQHIVEEMEFRGKDVSNFKNYTKKYFIEATGHDSNSFFKNTILPDLSDIRQIGRQHNNPFISFGKILGSVVETGDTSSNDTGNSNHLLGAKSTGATNNAYYDEIALNVVTAAGNVHLGAYTDSSGPNTLYCDTGSLSSPGSGTYTYQSVTEFKVSSSTIWLVLTTDNNSLNYKAKADGSTSTSFAATYTYGALTNPLSGAGSNTGGADPNMKINHS